MAASSSLARTFIRPPTLALLPRRRPPGGSMFSSSFLHVVAMAAWVFLPPLFPSPVVIPMDGTKSAAPEEVEPLVIPQLPPLADSGSGSSKAAKAAPGAGSGPTQPPADPPPQPPDYIGPQEIVSYVPNPVNRIQTIRRPDLINPPNIKYPLRLQSMVNLPTAPRPVLAPPPRPTSVPLAATPEEVPIAQLAVPNPALTLVPKEVAVAPSDVTPLQTLPIVPTPSEPEAKTAKPVVVVNAVNVPPDPGAAVPNAELAGNFVVGPAPGADATGRPLPAGTGRSAEGGPAKSGEPSRSSVDSGSGPGTGGGHTPGNGGANRADAGTGTGSGTVAGKGAIGGNGPAPNTGGNAGAGGGTGNGRAAGPSAGSGAPGRGGNGNSSGITISGGVPGRDGAIGNAVPLHRSYGMMIISGGSSGGASRDVGFFDRNETVYSVTISMADAGGGPDWTLQYALLNPAQAGTGLLTPPFVQKKVAAAMPASQFTGAGPVFIGGTIDENGKLQSLRAIRTEDVRSQPAIEALQQWEFQPAQLDGKPVASKVLIGVTVRPAN